LYLSTAIGLTPGGSSIAHNDTQTIHRTTQLTTLVGRLFGFRTKSGQTKIRTTAPKGITRKGPAYMVNYGERRERIGRKI
jgi:hypothetical protein